MLSNVAHAFRSLRRHPGYSLAAVLTLGLGMGAAASIYTLVQRVVLNPLPYPQADRLVRLKNPVPGVGKGDEWNLSTAQFFYYSQHVPGIAELGTYREDGANIGTSGEPLRGHAAIVSASMMRLLGARAVKGRIIDAHDDSPSAPSVAVLSEGFWRRQFGGDLGIVGKSVRLDDQPYEIIGVMAPGIELPPDKGATVITRSDVWIPMRLNPSGPFHNNHVYPVIARLSSGATAQVAQVQINRLLPELPKEFPNAYSQRFFDRYGFHTLVYPLKSYVIGGVARSLWILFGAVGLVLVIACANVGNLFLVRLESRRREFALRSALGAGRSDIAREAFSEGLVLAVAGAALALLLSVASTRWLVALAPPGIPRLDAIAVDWHVLLFTALVAVAIAAALAAVPAMQHRGATGLASLGEGGRSATAGVERQRLRGTLVVTQMALALMLVVGSSLLLQSFRRLRAVNPGVDPAGALSLTWSLPTQRYDSSSKIWRFHDDVLKRIRAIPGVTAAGASEELPLVTGFGCTVQGFDEPAVFERIKAAGLTTCAGQAPTTPGYFEALRIPLVAGRTFTDDDNTAPERGAVIVTKAFAERFWPGENPIGKGVNPNGRTKPPFYHVVGVVGDLRGSALDEPPAMGIFYPVVHIPGDWNWYPQEMHLVVRSSHGNPLNLLPAIRHAVNEVDPSIPLANAETMQTIVDRSMGRLSFTMTLLVIAGAVALALAAIGLYGLITYIVSRRTSEIGVRIALGAQRHQVERLVVGGALRLAALGLLIGVVAAGLSAKVLRGLLYGVAPWDPLAYAAAVAVLTVTAFIAGWIPARRAARVDPSVALRVE